MDNESGVVYEFDTAYGHYMVVDMVYEGRSARVLFSGNRQAAQSGIATDGKPELLFDYNQRMYELATGLRPSRLLLIGGGMCTLPMALLQVLPTLTIDVVELDDGLAPVAAEYFGLTEGARLTIINQDGLKYLASNQTQYDLILIDAYTHASAEPTLGSPEAITHLRRSLSPNGVVAANVIAAYFGRRSQALRELLYKYEHAFGAVKLFPASQSLSLWLPQNLLLTAELSTATQIEQYIRYAPLRTDASPFDVGQDLRAQH